jgi:hypothetical protein
MITFQTTLIADPRWATYTVIPVPEEVAAHFGKKRVRLKGTVNHHPIECALNSLGNGQFGIMVGAKKRKEAGISIGMQFEISLELDESEMGMTVPEELQAALDMEPGAWEAFRKISPGKRRGLMVYVNGGATVDTRIKYAWEVVRGALNGKWTSKGAKNPT